MLSEKQDGKPPILTSPRVSITQASSFCNIFSETPQKNLLSFQKYCERSDFILTESKKRGYYIFRAYFTLKDGTRVYARDYGKKAFRFFIEIK